MNFFHPVILGIVQGLTEFLPISSSGHLILVPSLLGWEQQSMVFDTTLHLATAMTLIVYFYKDLFQIARSVVCDLRKNSTKFGKWSKTSVLGLKILVASIPAGLLGFLFDSYFEEVFRNAGYVMVFLLLGTVLMALAELFYKKKVSLTEPSYKKAFLIGIFQSLALLPGVSRSGATISGGMLTGLTREASARFSFLISVPIVVAAGLFKLFSAGSVDPIYVTPADTSTVLSALPIFLGFISSFISGLVAVKFLLSFLKSNKLWVFIVYRIALILLIITL